MAKDYSEDQLIQRSAAELMEKELGWTSVYAFDKEVFGDYKYASSLKPATACFRNRRVEK